MKRMVPIVLFMMLASLAFAQGTPSSKATAGINTAVYCNVSNWTSIGDPVMTCHDVFGGTPVQPTADYFVPIMQTPVKVSNSQSLFVTPSLVTGLYTNTKVRTSTGQTSSATASGGVYLRAVLYDPSGNVIVAEPIKSCNDTILGCYSDGSGYKGVVLNSRVQTLTQDLSTCVVNIGGVAAGTCDFTLTTQLILQTTSAHSFGFIFPNVGVGVYTLSIEASIDSSAFGAGNATAVGGAAFGLGSVVAESVRLVHGFTF
jgi:hypothetical protein